MDLKSLSAERDQLINTWKRVSQVRWLETKLAPFVTLARATEADFGMAYRKCHNEFGWRAALTLKEKGLCSGAIYRSEAFMKLPQELRVGTKIQNGVKVKTVHIEHTVPTNVLAKKWVEYRGARTATMDEVLAWLLLHSVSTALHDRESNGYVKGESWDKKTFAFTADHPEFNRPFKRYNHHLTISPVWDIFTGELVDAETFSFVTNFERVLALMEETATDKVYSSEALNRLRTAAKPMIEAYRQPSPMSVAA